MLHELPRYPLRPNYQPGESLAGFVSRHFTSNGHEIPKPIGDAIATLYKSKLLKNRIAAWDLINEIIGRTADNYRRLWIEEHFTYARSSFIGVDEYWQKPLTRRFRICPQCVQSFGIHLALWDLPFVVACPIHHKFLIGRCDCGKVFHWSELKAHWTCRCGTQITRLSAAPAPYSLVNTAISIAAAAGFDVPILATKKMEKFRVADGLQSTYGVFSWLHLILHEMRNDEDRTPVGATPLPWRFGSALIGWPRGLIRHIRQVMARWHRTQPNDLLVLLSEKSKTKELLFLLRSAVRNKTLPSNLREAIRHLLNDINFEPLDSYRWIFNPALTISQREGKKSEVQLWWADLQDWMERADSSFVPATKIDGGIDQRAIDISAKILNSLARAATDPNAAMRFRRFARVWPPFPKDAIALSATEFLELMGRQLLTISSSHREYLYELSLNAGEVRNEVS